MAMPITHQETAERLIEVLQTLHGQPDARVSARRLVALVRSTIATADAVALHVLVPERRAFLTLAVYGYPHYGSTLVTSDADEFGKILSGRHRVWARSPGEVSRLHDVPDDGSTSYYRFQHYHRSIAGSTHHSVLLQPCLLHERLIATLWVENHTVAQAFQRREIDRIALIADVAALALDDARYATVFDLDGGEERWSIAPREHERSDSTRPSPSHAGDVTRAVAEQRCLDAAGPFPASLGPGRRLSIREAEVLALVARGLSNDETAKQLHISVNTVRAHRRSLMAKLETRNIAELVYNARKAGLLSDMD